MYDLEYNRIKIRLEDLCMGSFSSWEKLRDCFVEILTGFGSERMCCCFLSQKKAHSISHTDEQKCFSGRELHFHEFSTNESLQY